MLPPYDSINWLNDIEHDIVKQSNIRKGGTHIMLIITIKQKCALIKEMKSSCALKSANSILLTTCVNSLPHANIMKVVKIITDNKNWWQMHAQEWLSYVAWAACNLPLRYWYGIYCVVRDDQQQSYIYITLSTSNIIHLLHHYHVVLRGMLHSNILHIVVYESNAVMCIDR